MSLTHTQKLLEIMARLRHPDEGCAWDVKQDFASLVPYTLEEAYEVADAIERQDYDDLKAELGDLLLQIVFHSRIAEEQALFDFEQVANSIGEKLVRRHPHVFSDVKYDNDAARKQAWEDAKNQERQQKQVETQSILDDIPKNMPALMQCEKILTRVASHGFDWPNVVPVFAKVEEELEEVKEAWQSGDQAHIQEEIGDLLLVAVNLARHLNVVPEQALMQSNLKFSKRFNYIEQQVAKQNKQLKECPLEELDALWDEAKQKLKPSGSN